MTELSRFSIARRPPKGSLGRAMTGLALLAMIMLIAGLLHLSHKAGATGSPRAGGSTEFSLHLGPYVEIEAKAAMRVGGEQRRER